MSLSRSPSPRPGGGWASPGLTPGAFGGGASSPGKSYGDLTGEISGYYANGSAGSKISWAAAKAKSDQVRRYPSFSTRNNGFFSRQRRKISASLPRFRVNAIGNASKFGPGPVPGFGEGSLLSRILTLSGNLLRRTKIRLLVVFVIALIFWLNFHDPITQAYRASSWGSGPEVVLIVPSNIGGGVMEWKGAREWAIERHSLGNKRRYAKRWGYHFETPNMVLKKKYAHEWRESWEKVDVLRQAMRKYPQAKWFWWLDQNSVIMEPSISLHKHVLDNLEAVTYRDINEYNPLNITHPPDIPYLDPLSLSPVGDGKPSSINIIIPQDCAGFNLGSFIVRRSTWTDRLLDVWWDPVLYEQRHLQWDHKEQDVLEHLYTHHPWVRPHVAFIPLRRINSFPPGACGDGTDKRFHYQKADRDFVVNMAGCQWGRDCWSEIYHYRKLSDWLNRNPWEKFRDGVSGFFKKLLDNDEKEKKS
ncbi:hypothetical protein VTO42DRAFT_7973 [Malbranchea cinnamomea]